jgi:homoserine dehydrogenase
MPTRLALLGYGNVARALVALLVRKQAELRAEYGFEWSIVAASSRRLGAALDPRGLDPDFLLRSASLGPPLDAFELIARAAAGPPPADVLVELTVLDPHSGRPATDHVRAALTAGLHVVTANKGPLAFAYRELSALAAARGRRFLFESTVMDGAPIFSLARAGLRGATLSGFRGILNSTTNFILGRLEQGETLAAAVAAAQAIGIAEADPSNDLDGWDAAVKTVVLANVLMGADARPADVERTGIRSLDPAEVAAVPGAGARYKLICSATRSADDGALALRVAPERVPLADPLARVEGTSSTLTLYSDVLPELTIVEGRPGVDTTAFGVLADILEICTGSEALR